VALKSAPVVVFTQDRELRYTWVYHPTRGLSAEEVLGKTDEDLLSSQDAAPLTRIERHVLDNGAGVRTEVELTTGGLRNVYDLHVEPLRDAQGQIIGITCVALDITDRKRMEAQLMEAQHLAQLGSWEWDLTTDTVTWSEELYRIWGVDRHTFRATAAAVLQLVHPEDRAGLTALIDRAARAHEPYSCEHRIIRPDGTIRVLHSRGAAVVDDAGQVIRLFGTGQDITARQQAEETLRTYQRRLLEAQEAERQHLARELHDEIGQVLSAVKVVLQMVREAGHHPAMASYLDENVVVVDEALHRVRALALGLRPAMLDDLGLAPAVRWYAERYAQRRGLSTEVETAGVEAGGRLPRAVETACFRIVQEALTNVARHAHATQVVVAVTRGRTAVRVAITDNGVGFDPRARQQTSPAQGFGLQSMEERALLASGRLTIHSAPSQVTAIRAQFPLGPVEP
jgi:PAS domain S-box-containing protein